MRPPLALALAAIMPACAPPEVGPAVPGGGQVPIEASFSSISAVVFTPKCATCHPSQSPPDLSSTAAYAALVNAPASQTSDMLLVAPRDPDQSYLMLKLLGTHGTVGTGGTMPPGGAPLPDEELAAIAAWILNGAPND
jgi:mono/diheme cytochrome c family protein